MAPITFLDLNGVPYISLEATHCPGVRARGSRTPRAAKGYLHQAKTSWRYGYGRIPLPAKDNSASKGAWGLLPSEEIPTFPTCVRHTRRSQVRAVRRAWRRTPSS